MIHVISTNGSPPATIMVGGLSWLTMSQCIYTSHETYIGYICETNHFHLGWLWDQIKWMWLQYHFHQNTFCLIVGGFGTTSTKVHCFAKGSCGTSSTRVACSYSSVASGTNSTRASCSTSSDCGTNSIRACCYARGGCGTNSTRACCSTKHGC